MRYITLPDVDDIEVFDKIAAAKYRPRSAQMIGARPAVFDAYGRYGDSAPDLGGFANAVLTDLQKKVMRHAYTVETAPMIALRSDILDGIAAAKCPFCGINETSTLDHYLPKEQYPELSIFSANLVPCCPQCNTRKNDLVVEENTNVRLFIHPHFDQVPNLRFLKVEIDVKENVLLLGFRISRPGGMSLAMFGHLRSHFKLLNLSDRYRRMGLEHLGGQYRALKRAYGKAGDSVRVASELATTANDFAERYGENYWLAVLYRALAAHNGFCRGGFEMLKAV